MGEDPHVHQVNAKWTLMRPGAIIGLYALRNSSSSRFYLAKSGSSDGDRVTATWMASPRI